MRPLTVRHAAADDLVAVAAIYAHHVTTGVATFDIEPPGVPQWHERWAAIRADGLPFLVADIGGAVAGYAYCAPWKSRPAYRHTVESSIYLEPDAVGHGVGGRLLDALLDECAAAGVREVIAVVVDADADASLALHRGRGFAEVGRLTGVGYKHGRRLDTILLQRSLGPAAS